MSNDIANGGDTSITSPVQVYGYSTSKAQYEKVTAAYRLDSVIQIAAGGDHSVALTSGGAVYTWGYNSPTAPSAPRTCTPSAMITAL